MVNKNKPTVFVNTTGCNNWILKIIADDIVRELTERGIECRFGERADYQGESIVHHMWWRIAKPFNEAQINSVFVTHTDDTLKEHDLVNIKDSFDCFVTMSKEDEHFLTGLGFDPKRVFGLTLPVRNSYVRPLSIGIFSSCYPDYRKNEGWLLDFCKKNMDARLVNFVFIGSGWDSFVKQLQECGCSFEWHYASRSLPHEYFFQQLKLQSLDYYLYMGMDGGAMGTYDAYAMSVPLLVSDDGYHKDIPDLDIKFETREQFEKQLGEIVAKQKRRINFFTHNSVKNYVADLYDIWSGNQIEKGESNIFDNKQVVEKRRTNYFKISPNRVKQWVSSFLWRKKK